ALNLAHFGRYQVANLTRKDLYLRTADPVSVDNAGLSTILGIDVFLGGPDIDGQATGLSEEGDGAQRIAQKHWCGIERFRHRQTESLTKYDRMPRSLHEDIPYV